MKQLEWSKEMYENSVSSRCWWFTPYDAGWDGCREHGADISTDDELRGIVAMERELGDVPDWASLIVETSINFLPPCGHHLFPLAFLEAASAIGSETPPAFIHSCYTAERGRKERMLDYIFCLDAWLAGAGPEEAARELVLRRRDVADWPEVCSALWEILGRRNETKELRVERMIHRQRWWVKTLVWDDDSRDAFGRDRYLGDVRGSGDSYGNPDFLDPYFTELASPRVKKLEARAAELCPGGNFFWGNVNESWLCAPKAFRFLERELWSIGKERPLAELGEVPSFLQCEDTYPDPRETAKWWEAFCAALTGWWRGEREEGEVAEDVHRRLGEATDVKRWLVRLFVRRIQLLASMGGELKKLASPRPGAKRGTRPIA